MLVLAGYTATGKDSIQKILIEKYGMSPVVSYTTRPMRDGEEDGVSYHFISTDEFLKLKEEGFFAETTSYVMAGDRKVYYGSALQDLSDDKVAIMNPEGFRVLSEIEDLNIMSFLIVATRDVLIERLKARGDKENEYIRRLDADENDFLGMMLEVDEIIPNTGAREIEVIADEIYEKYRRKMEIG